MEKSIGKLITYLSRCIQQELKNVVVPFDISVGEEPYYMALTKQDGLTQDELTKLVKVDKAATARMVKSLEQKGYITRETDPKDKRNKKIHLTERGRLKYEPLSRALKEFNQKLTSEWTDEQYEIVYQSLEMLQKKFEIDNKYLSIYCPSTHRVNLSRTFTTKYPPPKQRHTEQEI